MNYCLSAFVLNYNLQFRCNFRMEFDRYHIGSQTFYVVFEDKFFLVNIEIKLLFCGLSDFLCRYGAKRFSVRTGFDMYLYG